MPCQAVKRHTMSHALVTGGAGFIGSHLCEELLKEGNRVISIDNFATGASSNISHLGGNSEFESIKCDILDREKTEKILKENTIDTVFHYAAVVGVKRTLENPMDVLNVNIEGTRSILEAALNAGCRKVVYASSSEVYGHPIEVPEREDSPKNVELPYAIAKLVGEKLARVYNDNYGLRTTSLRLFNVYGPRQNSTPYGFVVGIFIDRVLKNRPPIIYGDGFATRDFTFIKDNIAPTIIAAKSRAANGEVFNIAAGKPVTMLDLAELIIELCGKELKPDFQPKRPLDIKHRFADISKMRTILGYKPEYDLRTGLKITIDWYRNRHEGKA